MASYNNCVIFKTSFLLHVNSSFHKARDSTIPIKHRLAQKVGLQIATTDMIPICRSRTQTTSAQLLPACSQRSLPAYVTPSDGCRPVSTAYRPTGFRPDSLRTQRSEKERDFLPVVAGGKFPAETRAYGGRGSDVSKA
jgi:hypothetical protein